MPDVRVGRGSLRPQGRMTLGLNAERIRSLSVVLPAHNEEGNIESVTRDALRVLPGLVDWFEVIIVDDGSEDRTRTIADRVAREDQRVVVIHHPKNMGYGHAWRSGIAASKSDWIFFMDADRQFDIEEIGKLLHYAPEADIVTGYRIKREDPQYRFLIGSCFNVLVKALFRVHLHDIDCGFKIFRAPLLKSMELNMPGALINTEIHAKANQAGARLVEVGITHHPRGAGRQSGTKLKVMARAVVEIVALRIQMAKYGHKRPTKGLEADTTASEGGTGSSHDGRPDLSGVESR